ncbi:class I SAM-dependent methyltransferase [Limnobacter humi]|uniref:Class I SAM-dependent methyltransferase n=1 Tax=Limnobacter humi TaxID=1778671 RepID=A0ABT1WF33_9BURK|nr:class I SAM-dependent methyltransferase [Limnobacter humi]MCQ8896125.1 class I SAM-dependent methyltransferase [Limnobacter humi]
MFPSLFPRFARQFMSAARISPTALYTAQVWQESGRSVPELASLPAKALYTALSPAMAMSRSFGGPTLQDFLLARHDLIDRQLHQAITSGKATQVLEIAAGLSPRGSRFVQEYGDDITYIEADLPGMVAQKRKLLEQRLAVCPYHRIEVIDAFATDGVHSLAGLAAQLDPERGLVIITEGLLNYFDRASVLDLWTRVGQTLSGFQRGFYFSDLHFSSHNDDLLSRAFAAALGAFVRGKIHLHFSSIGEVQQLMQQRGLACEVLNPSDFAAELASCTTAGAHLTRVLSASAMTY